MRVWLAVASLGIGFGMLAVACGSDNDGGGASPVEACKSVNKVVCDKIFNCLSQEELELNKAIVGLNSADCIVRADAECTPDDTNCKAGETYHADKASACVDGYKTYNCDDIRSRIFAGAPNPTPDPAACALRCTK